MMTCNNEIIEQLQDGKCIIICTQCKKIRIVNDPDTKCMCQPDIEALAEKANDFIDKWDDNEFAGQAIEKKENNTQHEKVNCKEVRKAAERLGVTWEDARRYAKALAKWRKAGYPMRSRKEVNKIIQKHCKPCEYNANGRCRKCRCQVNKGRFPLTNKIKMATEHCLLGNW